jgi:GT2 family glycosyltransferase
MIRPTVSVVIVSRHRPDALCLCLKGVARLSYPAFEIIVVADPAGVQAVAGLPFADKIKTIVFDQANIAAARNRGIARASGQVIAFLDDDAVPETRWLEHLVSPFDDPSVAAAGGYVLARNGISFQWKGRVVDHTGRSKNVTLDKRFPTVLTPPSGWAVKTEGTNMALRKDVLVRMGGFDPAFRFFLDETDVNMRLAKSGLSTAIVPLALVHHGFAASAQRRSDRAVRDLYEIAASTAVYLRKYCPAAQRSAALSMAWAEQETRMVKQLITGRQEPGDILRLRRSWRDGLADGQMRDLTDPIPVLQTQEEFLPFPAQQSGESVVIKGFLGQSRDLHEAAAHAAAAGNTVSLFLFSRSTLFHRVRFHNDSYWEQTGGLWGRSQRTEPLFRPWTLDKRVTHELERIGLARLHQSEIQLS